MLSMQRGAQGAGLGHVISSRQIQNGWQLSTVEYHEARKWLSKVGLAPLSLQLVALNLHMYQYFNRKFTFQVIWLWLLTGFQSGREVASCFVSSKSFSGPSRQNLQKCHQNGNICVFRLLPPHFKAKHHFHMLVPFNVRTPNRSRPPVLWASPNTSSPLSVESVRVVCGLVR